MAGVGDKGIVKNQDKTGKEDEEKISTRSRGLKNEMLKRSTNQPLIVDSLRRKTVTFSTNAKDRIRNGGKGGNKGDNSIVKKQEKVPESDSKNNNKEEDEGEMDRMYEKMMALTEQVEALMEKRKEDEVMYEDLMCKNEALMNKVEKLGYRVECLENKVVGIEKKMTEYEEEVRYYKEVVVDLLSEKVEEGSVNDAASEKSVARSWRTRLSVKSSTSCISGISLSQKEVVKMKRLVSEKDRDERRLNIVIKGLGNIGEKIKEEIEKFLKEKLAIEAGLHAAWRSGQVVVGKCTSYEQKEMIMKNKARLAGTRIYIENDLSFEDRKIQEKIARWARAQREKGREVKVGLGRVMVDEKWIRWESVPEEEQVSERQVRGKDGQESMDKSF
ncbi:uncharacterized protein LOC106651336 [Trichogramma pretiosum]|uniref:uncharacterized protein LOC106651336 n=1 Tax=Trichogramma pretiosum TaxID=7493 RepID=UPI000C71C1F1|nr:uncharacterized protein LOC106651336 [Trichogramma pretiosum]